MPAVSSMILRSMQMIGEKSWADNALTTDEATNTLYALNSFMDSSGIDRLLCYQLTQESFALTSNTVSYTIGSGATFNTTRPTRIVDPCFIRDSSSLDSPVTILKDADQYGKIVQKNVGATYPSYLYYDSGFDASGYGTIYVYPAPSGSLTIYINSPKQLQNFASVSTHLLLPPGYQLFIESNFAIHLAAGLTPVSPEVMKIAKESKAAIKNINLPEPISRLDAGIVRGNRTNILTGP